MNMSSIAKVLLPAAFLLAGCTVENTGEPAKAAFSFETATPDEQTEWLTTEANELNRGFKKGLNSSYSAFKVGEPTIDVRKRKITLTAESRQGNKFVVKGAQQIMLQELACKDYLRSKLRTHGVKTAFILTRPNGTIASTLYADEGKCRKYLPKA